MFTTQIKPKTQVKKQQDSYINVHVGAKRSQLLLFFFFFFFFVSQQAPNFSLRPALSFSLCKKTIMVSERKKGMEKPK
jgi:hypothetical protein